MTHRVDPSNLAASHRKVVPVRLPVLLTDWVGDAVGVGFRYIDVELVTDVLDSDPTPAVPTLGVFIDAGEYLLISNQQGDHHD